MKLKNSHILLIVMSLFLLISIGSVSASDAAMDAYSQLADDGSINAVLTDEASGEAQINTTVVSQDVIINEGEFANITVNVKDNESQDISINKGDLKVIEANKTVNFDYNNTIVTLKDKLPAGNHTLIISYLGNANYTASSTKIILSVVGNYTLIVPSSVDVNSTKKVTIPIKLTDSVNYYNLNKDNLTLTISYKEGNKTQNFEFINGTIYFDYDYDISTSLIIKYMDENKTLNTTIALNRIYNANVIVLNAEAEYASGNFTFKLIDKDTNEILVDKSITVSGTKNGSQLEWITYGSDGTISITSSTTIKSDSNGIATLKNQNFYPGYYFAAYTYAPIGEDYILTLRNSGAVKANNTTNMKINKANINITINPYKEQYGSDKKVVINVTNAKTGEPMKGIILHLYMENTTSKDYYFQTGDNGTAEINVSGLISGNYPLTVSNNDTENINAKSVDGVITIDPKPVKFDLKVTTTYYYNSGNIATVTVTDKATGEVVPNAIILVQAYTGSSSIAYLYQANEKGVATINYAPLSVGKHKLVISSADTRFDGSPVTKTVTVKKATGKFTAAKVTTYYKSGKNFVIKLTNTKNNKPIYGANVDIKIYISGGYYQYTGQTGLDGTIQLSLKSLTPGTYKVEIVSKDSKNYTASKISSQIVIKKAPIKISATKVTAKKGADKYFQVTVKNTKLNKVITGIKIKFKVYTGKSYKIYTATTNSKGIAKISVKSLSVGTHKVVVTSGNKYCTGNTATSSIKITKA